MAEQKLTIRLTENQQKQVKDATGNSVTDVNISFFTDGELSDAELDNAAGGIEFDSFSFAQ